MKFGLLSTLSKKISRRYAKAFFDTSVRENCVIDVQTDTMMLLDVLNKSPEFRDFIQNPQHPSCICDDVLKKILEDSIHPLTFKFLLFLNEKGRLSILRGILEQFNDFFHLYHGVTKIQIISAVELAPEQVQKICDKLKARWHRGIFAESIVDPELIGGFQIKSGDRVLDLSFRNQLENYRNHVINA